MQRLSCLKTLGVSLTGLGLALSASAIPMGSAVVGGLLQFDYVNFSGDKQDVARSSGDVRRANIWIKGDLPKDWSYQLGYDARYNLVETSWIGYNGFDYFWLAMGFIDIPQSLDYWSSYTNNTFMEYASPIQAFQPHKGMGLYADGLAGQDMFSYQAALYSPDIYTREEVQVRTRSSEFGNRSDELAGAVRGVVRPDVAAGNILHLGASGRYEGVSNSDVLNALVTTPNMFGRESGDRDNILVSSLTPTAGDVDAISVWGVEVADVYGAFSGQAEYTRTHWSGREHNSALDFWGWYAQLAYVITGETRAYDTYSGTIGSVESINNDYGSWELALRYGYANLSDNATAGYDANDKRGIQDDWTLGVNWYVIENVKLQANFAYANADYSNGGLGDKHVKSMGVRAQVDF